MTLVLLFCAGCVSGAMNAAAGGGTFVTFPALVFAGLPALNANASTTVALFPGSMASLFAYRSEPYGVPGVSRNALAVASILGGLIGALLLLFTPPRDFDRVVPFLLLLAAVALIFGPRVRPGAIRISPRGILVLQFFLGIYGGYFGGAVGIMMMAVWTMLGTVQIKTLLPLKALLAGTTNGVAVLTFIIAGTVRWRETLPTLLGAATGGYFGAHLARRLPEKPIRAFVIAITFGMAIYFFARW
jgi:uncharacterized membrane protein YfcA